MDKKFEQTLVLIKPDALKNSLTGYVLSQLSEFHTGLRFAGAKIVHVSRMLADEHYAEHRGKIFFPSLLDYITGSIHYPGEPWKHRVIAIVYQGPDATKKIRNIAGPTNPHIAREQAPGCIRALGTVVPLKDVQENVIGERMDNLIHASATDSEAEREIKLWFKPNDIPPFMHAYPTELSDDYYYFRNNKLHKTNEQGSICFLTPGDVAWKSDLEAVRLLSQGREASLSLAAVVAKYLINDKRESH
jgi:nucleoside-diphosphate kinase